MTAGSRDHMSFRLRTCGSAHVALSQLAAVTDVASYELDIGMGVLQDTLRIRSGGVEKAKKSVLDIGSCRQERDFWVGWRGGTVQIGLGTIPGDSSMVSWTDPNPHEVNFVGTASSDGDAAYWDLQAIQGRPITLIGCFYVYWFDYTLITSVIYQKAMNRPMRREGPWKS